MTIVFKNCLCLLAVFTGARGSQSSAACAMDNVTCKLAYELSDEVALIQRHPALIQRHGAESEAGQSSKVVLEALAKTQPAATGAAAHATTKTAPSKGWDGPLFFDVKTMDLYQLIIVTALYGYVLYLGSNMIGDGAEQLQFFPSISGIVGSVVVPILGAVPEAVMVLCAGLGENAKVRVITGVGALAGSSVMLLTFPWFVVIMAGSVPLRQDGRADYSKKDEPVGMFSGAVSFNKSLNFNAMLMVITSFAFLVIQIPAMAMKIKGTGTAYLAAAENVWALVGFLVCQFLFFSYIIICYLQSRNDERINSLIDAIDTEQVVLSAFSFHQSDPDDMKRGINLKSEQSPEDSGEKGDESQSEPEAEEVPEDLADLSPEEQSRAMLTRSCWNMTAGAAVVLLFTDPACSAFTEWGSRLGISPFYVGFLLAPFASNASELLVAYGMALKKTSKSVTQSFESLVGAACMNNTFVLMVFFLLVYFQKIAWQFKAETMSILTIQWTMAVIILSSTTQSKFTGLLILSLYPLCMVLVYVMENFMGWN